MAACPQEFLHTGEYRRLEAGRVPQCPSALPRVSGGGPVLGAADRTFLHRNLRYEVWQIRDVYQESKYLNAYQGWSSVKVFFNLAVSSVRNCPKAYFQEAEVYKTKDQQETVIIFRRYEQWSSHRSCGIVSAPWTQIPA